jgi:CheY-like chemotaxis protein
MLEEQGFRVEITANGHDGLERLKASVRPLVAVISNVLTDLTAAKLLERLATEPQLARGHAYVLMTLSPDAARRKLSGIKRALPVLLLESPHDLERLCGAVHEAAGRLERTRSSLTVH